MLKKDLGQHFLEDRAVLSRIVDEAAVCSSDALFEVGPGSGNLTSLLVRKAGIVVAVELDRRFEKMLESLARTSPCPFIVHFGNALSMDFMQILSGVKPSWKVVANIPYYITSPLIEKMLLCPQGLFSDLYLTIQKEMALRICAGPGGRDYGSFSIFVQYHAEASLLCEIPRTAFRPVPLVDSALIRLRIRQSPLLLNPSPLLFPLVRKAFNQRRKGIRNSLKGFPSIADEKCLAQALEKCGIPALARPEELSVHQFNELSHCIALQSEAARRALP